MKKTITLFTLLIVLFLNSCGENSLKYDFSKISSEEEMNALLAKIAQDNETVKLDTINGINSIEVKGMHYSGVPVKSALTTSFYALLKTDTINFSGKKLLEAIEAKKGLTNVENTYNGSITFNWETEDEDLDFSLNLIKGKHLAALTDKDNAELTINYKPIYNVPIANIHKKIKRFSTKPEYILNIMSYGEYTIIMNDITIVENSIYSEYDLMNFITDNTKIKLKIKVSCKDKNATFDKSIRFSASISDASTQKKLAFVPDTELKGKKQAEFTLEFTPNLPWYPKAWTEGEDLRNDKNLNQKIKDLYKKVGDAFLAKDEETISALLYQKQFESQQILQDDDFKTARAYWETLKVTQNSSYKYSIANNFTIEYSANGKLIKAQPKNKRNMLIFTGKQYDQFFNFYFYQPKGTNELQIIR